MKYSVLWINLWKKLTKFMSLAISLPLAFVFIIRFFSNGMSIEVTFQHVTLPQLPLFFIAIVAGSALFSFLVAYIFKFAAVEIDGEYLIGRNYWFVKKQIPIKSIERLYPFSNNGIEAVVADAGSYGKVYISTHTNKLDELLEFLEQNSSAGNV